ncbi:MAG: hypothetical protein WC456_04445 [Patescibacteria group bacterium]
MKRNKIIWFITLLILGLLFFVLLVLNFLSKSTLTGEILQEVHHKNYALRIYKEGSGYSFGSGHKILVLYDGDKLVEKKIYGNHPIRIESISNDVVKIIIPITFYEKNDVEYIKGWCDKNKKIGSYIIDYNFFYDPATSTDKFLYPRN